MNWGGSGGANKVLAKGLILPLGFLTLIALHYHSGNCVGDCWVSGGRIRIQCLIRFCFLQSFTTKDLKLGTWILLLESGDLCTATISIDLSQQ